MVIVVLPILIAVGFAGHSAATASTNEYTGKQIHLITARRRPGIQLHNPLRQFEILFADNAFVGIFHTFPGIFRVMNDILDFVIKCAGMKGVNQQIKLSMIDMKAHLNIMGRNGEEIDKLKAKQTGLTSVISVQNQKVELAKSNYEACKAAVEGNADATHSKRMR